MREIEPLVLQIKNRGFGKVLLDLLGGDHRAVVVSTAEKQILESISIQTVLLKHLERRSATSTLFKSENGKFVFYH